MSEPSRRRGITMNIGQTEVTKLGVHRYNWHDTYHIIMSLTWPQFFAGAVTVYLLANCVFATAYYIAITRSTTHIRSPTVFSSAWKHWRPSVTAT